MLHWSYLVNVQSILICALIPYKSCLLIGKITYYDLTGAYGHTDYGATSYQPPPTVSVTDYGSSSYPPDNGFAPDNRGYEEDYSPPTDFDALFSGESRPSLVVSGKVSYSRRNILQPNL